MEPSSPRLLPGSLLWLLRRFLLLVFGRLLKAYVLHFAGLICEILLTSRKALQKPVACIQEYVFYGKSTELKFLDNKSYLWRNKLRQYWAGPRCCLSGKNFWHVCVYVYKEVQVYFVLCWVFGEHLFYVCWRKCTQWLSVVIYWHKPYAKNHALTFYQKTVREMLPTVYAEQDEPQVYWG